MFAKDTGRLTYVNLKAKNIDIQKKEKLAKENISMKNIIKMIYTK